MVMGKWRQLYLNNNKKKEKRKKNILRLHTWHIISHNNVQLDINWIFILFHYCSSIFVNWVLNLILILICFQSECTISTQSGHSKTQIALFTIISKQIYNTHGTCSNQELHVIQNANITKNMSKSNSLNTSTFQLNTIFSNIYCILASSWDKKMVINSSCSQKAYSLLRKMRQKHMLSVLASWWEIQVFSLQRVAKTKGGSHIWLSQVRIQEDFTENGTFHMDGFFMCVG